MIVRARRGLVRMALMATKIDAYFLRCDEGLQYKGYVGQIEDTLDAYQQYVCGPIQVVSLTQEIAAICNEEGKLFQLPLNRALVAGSQVQDYFVGDILCVRRNGDEFSSIAPEDIAVIERCLIPLKKVLKVRGYLLFTMYPASFCSEWQE